MHMYPINGACHRVGSNDTAFAYRDATYGMVFLAGWTDPAKDDERIKSRRDYYQALSPARTRRLGSRTYDPHNLFHMNQNIGP
jgi:hypothetical protein